MGRVFVSEIWGDNFQEAFFFVGGGGSELGMISS